MRIAILMFAVLQSAACFDLSSIDTGNANWLTTSPSVADITIHVKSNVVGFFQREDYFPYRYVGPKSVVQAGDPNGPRGYNFVTEAKRPIPALEQNGIKAWLYVKNISDKGAQIRCVVREPSDNGKILYEREFLIPWMSRVFSLHTNDEQFDAKILTEAK